MEHLGFLRVESRILRSWLFSAACILSIKLYCALISLQEKTLSIIFWGEQVEVEDLWLGWLGGDKLS